MTEPDPRPAPPHAHPDPQPDPVPAAAAPDSGPGTEAAGGARRFVPSWPDDTPTDVTPAQPVYPVQQAQPGPPQDGPLDPWGPPTPAVLGPDGWPMPPAQQPPAAQPGRRGRRAGVALVLTAALLVGLLGGVVGSWLVGRYEDRQLLDSTAALPSTQGAATRSRAPESVAGVAGRVLPSVVALQVTSGTGQGTGSGFVIDSRGYILTNNHVVSSAAQQGRIDIVFQDGSQTRGRIVGRDENYDLAVLKADVGDRPPLRLGDSEGVVVGDPVIAIGAPLGLQGTVTTGIISAKNRPVTAGDDETTAFINALQTDTAINPGNSGGPLVDAAGEVIGVNSAIARTPGSTSSTGGNIGLGFAISSNQARRTAEQLIRTGRSEYPIIGVNLDQAYQGQGVRVATEAVQGRAPVEPGGPAGRAGIEAGDVITAIDGRPVTAPDELIVAIRDKAVGDTVTLSVRGDGGRAAGRDVRVTLVAAPRTAD